jgi:hypothetical protein
MLDKAGSPSAILHGSRLLNNDVLLRVDFGKITGVGFAMTGRFQTSRLPCRVQTRVFCVDTDFLPATEHFDPSFVAAVAIAWGKHTVISAARNKAVLFIRLWLPETIKTNVLDRHRC